MKRYLVVAAILVLSLSVCFLSSMSLAQEEEEMEYSWGTVSKVSSNQIVVPQYDYESGEEVDVTYTVDPNVELENVDSLKSIAVGDNVDINYVIKGDKRIAKVITVEKTSYEEEYTPLETYEE